VFLGQTDHSVPPVAQTQPVLLRVSAQGFPFQNELLGRHVGSPPRNARSRLLEGCAATREPPGPLRIMLPSSPQVPPGSLGDWGLSERGSGEPVGAHPSVGFAVALAATSALSVAAGVGSPRSTTRRASTKTLARVVQLDPSAAAAPPDGSFPILPSSSFPAARASPTRAMPPTRSPRADSACSNSA
jgi:hypothetical protein